MCHRADCGPTKASRQLEPRARCPSRESLCVERGFRHSAPGATHFELEHFAAALALAQARLRSLAAGLALFRRVGAAAPVGRCGPLQSPFGAAPEAAWGTAFRELGHGKCAPAHAAEERASRQFRRPGAEQRASARSRALLPASGSPRRQYSPAGRQNTRFQRPARLPPQKPTTVSNSRSRPALRAY
jgi:hypothetical protein